MRKIIITGLLLCSKIVAVCQDIYINNNGDSVHGKITNYAEWVQNPPIVAFQESTGNTLRLTPLTCKAFYVGNSDIYISYSGDRILNSDNATDINSLKSNAITREHIDVFLRQIYSYKGFTLYKYFNGERTNFYLLHNDVLKELEYYEYVDEDNHIHTDDAYKNYIVTQLKDVNVTDKVNKASRLTYKEDDLINFFAGILNDKAHSSSRKRIKYANEFFAGAGLHANFGSIDYQNGYTAHATSTVPLLEAGIKLHAQRNFGKAFLQASVAFDPFNNNFSNTRAEDFKISATTFSLRLGPGYTFTEKPDLSTYATFLMSFDFLFDYKVTSGTGRNATTVTSPVTLTKLSLIPEAGLILYRKLNVGIQFTLPYIFPLYFPVYYHYSTYAAGIVVRYTFK